MSFVPGIDTVGDMCVQRLSEMILNDVPSADPRWGDTNINGKFIERSYFLY